MVKAVNYGPVLEVRQSCIIGKNVAISWTPEVEHNVETSWDAFLADCQPDKTTLWEQTYQKH